MVAKSETPRDIYVEVVWFCHSNICFNNIVLSFLNVKSAVFDVKSNNDNNNNLKIFISKANSLANFSTHSNSLQGHSFI